MTLATCFSWWSLDTPFPSWEPASAGVLEQRIHPDPPTEIRPHLCSEPDTENAWCLSHKKRNFSKSTDTGVKRRGRHLPENVSAEKCLDRLQPRGTIKYVIERKKGVLSQRREGAKDDRKSDKQTPWRLSVLARRDRTERTRIKTSVASVPIQKETAWLHRYMQRARSLFGSGTTSQLLHERRPQSMMGRIS